MFRSRPGGSPRAWFVAGWMLLAACAVAGAQQTPGQTDAVPSPTPANGEALRQQVADLEQQLAAATDLPEDVRPKIEQALRTAQTDLKAAQDAAALATQFMDRAVQVETAWRELTTELTNLREQPAPRVPAGDSLEPTLTQTQQELAAFNADRSQMPDPQARSTRRRTLRDQLRTLPSEIAAITQQLQSPPVSGDPVLLVNAIQAQLQARKRALERQLALAEAELALYDAEDPLELPRLRRELLDVKIARQKKFVEALEAALAARRRAIAADRVRQAQNALDSLTLSARPVLEPLVNDSLLHARQEFDVRQERQRYVDRLELAQQTLESVERQLEQASTRVQQVGLTPSLGLRLRQQRQELEDVREIRRRMETRFAVFEQAQMDYLDLNDQLNALPDLETEIDQMLEAAAGAGIDPALVRRELERRRTYLADAVQALDDYTDTLDELDSVEQLLVQANRRYAAFIDEHILWIRSHRPLSWAGIQGDKLALLWLLKLRLPEEIGATLAEDVPAHSIYWGLFAVAWLLLMARGGKIRRRIRELARTAQARGQTQFGPTLHAWWLSLLISLPWPGLMLFVSWRLADSEFATAEVAEFGRRLAEIGLAFLFFECFRQTWRRHGLAEAHFEWSDHTVDLLRSTFRVLIFAGIPLGILIGELAARERVSGGETDALEMLAFIAAQVVTLYCLHRLLRPSTGVLRNYAAYAAGSWIDRLRGAFWLAAVAVPIALIVLTVVGYYYTAQQLIFKVEVTAWLLLAALFIRAMLYRWLMLRHRRLRIDQLRQRQAAAQEAAAEAGQDQGPSDIPEVAADEAADLQSISRQTQRLVNTTLLILSVSGLWLIWVDVLPALNYLDRWGWETYETIQESVELDGGRTEVREVTRVRTITAVNVLWLLLLVFLTFTAARNVPGLLEISILQRLPLDASYRYAVSAVSRYLIVLLGIILAAQAIGIGWSKVQWLAAALTVGLGFGLQEIFANFVSGLIILFEQPVRVGDVVTIDSVSGVVSRIRIRATTITDWDRKDYVVPNKEFITGKLLNWTLSDTLTRLTIRIGVAYGSDTDRVTETLRRVLREHPVVLADPPPVIAFEGFGDSSLNFLVFAFLPSLDKRLPTTHDLNSAIHRELAKAGIEIPFPQRDLHVRTIPEGLLRPGSNGPSRSDAVTSDAGNTPAGTHSA